MDSSACPKTATSFLRRALVASLHLSMQYMLSVLPFLALKHPAMHSSFSSIMLSISLTLSDSISFGLVCSFLGASFFYGCKFIEGKLPL